MLSKFDPPDRGTATVQQALRTEKDLEQRIYEAILDNTALKQKLAGYADLVRQARTLADQVRRTRLVSLSPFPSSLGGFRGFDDTGVALISYHAQEGVDRFFLR